jgi:hypothetical protein
VSGTTPGLQQSELGEIEHFAFRNDEAQTGDGRLDDLGVRVDLNFFGSRDLWRHWDHGRFVHVQGDASLAVGLKSAAFHLEFVVTDWKFGRRGAPA